MIPRVRVMDRGHGSGDAGDLSVVHYEDPDALIFKGKQSFSMYARVCGECGHVEFFVENPAKLYKRYREGKEPGT